MDAKTISMAEQGQNFEPTEKLMRFVGKDFSGLRRDEILVEVENSLRGLYWRMTVNGKPSIVTSYYEGILIHEGYGLVTAYYDGAMRPFVPFQLDYAEEVK